MKKPHRFIAAAASFLFFTALNVQAQEISLEKLPPVVVKTLPQSGDTAVDAGLNEISVTFSKDMADSSYSMVQVSADTFPEMTGKPHYLPDKRTCAVHVELEPGRTYAILLNSNQYTNFKDINGQSALPYLLVFKTKNIH